MSGNSSDQNFMLEEINSILNSGTSCYCSIPNLSYRLVSKNFFFLLALQPNAGYGLLIHEVFLDHTQPTQHSR